MKRYNATATQKRPGGAPTPPARHQEGRPDAAPWYGGLAVTSPIVSVTVCPSCEHSYETWYGASINLELDPEFTEAYIERMTSGTGSACGHGVALGGLAVGTDGSWEMRRSE